MVYCFLLKSCAVLKRIYPGGVNNLPPPLTLLFLFRRVGKIVILQFCFGGLFRWSTFIFSSILISVISIFWSGIAPGLSGLSKFSPVASPPDPHFFCGGFASEPSYFFLRGLRPRNTFFLRKLRPQTIKPPKTFFSKGPNFQNHFAAPKWYLCGPRLKFSKGLIQASPTAGFIPPLAAGGSASRPPCILCKINLQMNLWKNHNKTVWYCVLQHNKLSSSFKS